MAIKADTNNSLVKLRSLAKLETMPSLVCASERSRIRVEAQATDGVLLETYSYGVGEVEPLPTHAHAEYQIALSFSSIGEYGYRGAKLKIPTGSLCILHSGEPHTPSEARMVVEPAFYWMLYAEPQEFVAAAAEIIGKPLAELPHFSQILIADKDLVTNFLQLFELDGNFSSQLGRDETRLKFFTNLISRYANNLPSAARIKDDAPRVNRVLEFLHANFRDNVSLEDLAQLSGISKFHLCRAFRHRTGLSPHVYQTNLRLSHSKKLLLGGLPTSPPRSVSTTKAISDKNSNASSAFPRKNISPDSNFFLYPRSADFLSFSQKIYFKQIKGE